MKKILLVCAGFLGLITTLQAQCGNDNTLIAGDLTPSAVGSTVTLNYGAGQYVTAYVFTGASYTVTTCSTSSFDTQLTIYDDAGTVIGYNDDYCDLQSSITFTASSCSYIHILLDQYSCNNSGLLTDVAMTQNTAASAGIDSIQCAADTVLYTDNFSCGVTGATLNPPYLECLRLVGNDAPVTFPIGLTMVTWTAVNDLGGMVSCVQNVTVLDTFAPVPTCVNDTMVAVTGLCGISSDSLVVPLFTENCSIDTLFNDAPVFLPPGNTTITWTFIDSSGNTAGCSQVITVIDTQAPVIVCPADTIIGNDPGLCSATISGLGTPLATDNCTISTISNDAPSTLATGAYAITWTATDVNGLTGTCIQNLLVIDNELPVIDCPADTVIPASLPGCSGIAGWAMPGATDNCGIDTSYTDHQPGDTLTGTTTITFTAIDMAGNISTCTFNVTIDAGITIGLTPTSQSSATPNGTITMSISGGTLPYLYDWNNDGTGDFDDTQDLSGLAAGTYTVLVADSNGCTAGSSAVVNNTVGIDEPGTGVDARVYPNPGNGHFVLEMPSVGNNTVVEIYNTTGNMVYTAAVMTQRSTIDLSEKTGLLLLRIRQDGHYVHSQTLIIQH